MDVGVSARGGELRPNMGHEYLATVVRLSGPKHQADDPEQIAALITQGLDVGIELRVRDC